VLNDRRTRLEDQLFIALLLIPAIFAGARFLESKSQMEQIALHNRLPVAILAKAPAPTQLVDAAVTSIVHRF
jgi:hypothetical protein